MTRTKYLSAREFWEEGYLQELNRQFLHPHGLALSVDVNKDSKGEITQVTFGRIIDSRDDPEGIVFAEFDEDGVRKGLQLEFEFTQKVAHRIATLGFGIQPLEEGKYDAGN